MAEPSTLKGSESAEVKELKAEVNSLQSELNRVKAQLKKRDEENAALAAQLPPQPKPYEYKEGECHPVQVPGKCPTCGWDSETQTKPGMVEKQPHAVI